MRLKLLISNVFKSLRALIYTYIPITRAERPLNNRFKPRGGRKRAEFDVDRAMRLRRDGYSDRRIARIMGGVVSANTITARLNELESAAPVAQPIAQVQEAPVTAYKPPVLPVLPKTSAPVPAPSVVPPPEPFGLASIPAGCKAFFLVHGSQNQQYAANCAQPCIGIEQWNSQYMELPAFQAVEKIWVLMNSSEENRAFLGSLVGDITIRERCLISVDNGATLYNQPVRLGTWVQYVAKARLLMERPHDGSRPDTSGFETKYNFQPIPLPSHTDKLNELLKSPEREPERPSSFGEVEQWRWRW